MIGRRGRWPPIKVIATSGRYLLRDGDLPSGGLFLAKPYSPTQISSALREVTAQAWNKALGRRPRSARYSSGEKNSEAS